MSKRHAAGSRYKVGRPELSGQGLSDQGLSDQGRKPMTRHRLAVLTVASMFALSLTASAVLAAGEPDPPGSRNPNPIQKQSPAGQKAGTKKKKKQSEIDQEFRDGYRAAYALVQQGDYKAAYAAFKALDADYTPDVAN